MRSARGNNINADVAATLDKPRCKVWRLGALGALVAGAAGTISFDSVEYDTDGMANPLGVFVTCRTNGVYLVQAQVGYNDGFVGPFQTRLLHNNNTALTLANDTRVDAAFRGTPFGTNVAVSGLWAARGGDTVQLYVLAQAANATLAVGQYNLFMSACLIST